MPGKARSKRAIRLLEQADRCLEALSQILPLPAMTGRGIVVHYALFDRIEQLPVILKELLVFGHTTGHGIPFNRPIKRHLPNGMNIYEGQRVFAHCLLAERAAQCRRNRA